MSLSLLNAARPLLADGAMATNLFERGLRPGDSAELWNLTQPERVQALHRDFLVAGADILLTNSFGGHPRRLRHHGLADRVAEVNLAAARNARAAADSHERPVIVAGAVGPTGDRIMADEAAEGFRLQMNALAGGGVDLLWIETLSDPVEMRMAAEAAAATGLPYAMTASFNAEGRTLAGLDARGFAGIVAGFPEPALLVGANCGDGAGGLLRDLEALREAAPERRLAIKASAGLPVLRDGRLHYPMAPADMADYARQAAACGAAVIGGCCGTTPAHLAAMASALSEGAPAALARSRHPS